MLSYVEGVFLVASGVGAKNLGEMKKVAYVEFG